MVPPGSCDLLTTGEDARPEFDPTFTEEFTASGWRLRHYRLDRTGRTRRVDIEHPTLGWLTYAVYRA